MLGVRAKNIQPMNTGLVRKNSHFHANIPIHPNSSTPLPFAPQQPTENPSKLPQKTPFLHF